MQFMSFHKMIHVEILNWFIFQFVIFIFQFVNFVFVFVNFIFVFVNFIFIFVFVNFILIFVVNDWWYWYLYFMGFFVFVVNFDLDLIWFWGGRLTWVWDQDRWVFFWLYFFCVIVINKMGWIVHIFLDYLIVIAW